MSSINISISGNTNINITLEIPGNAEVINDRTENISLKASQAFPVAAKQLLNDKPDLINQRNNRLIAFQQNGIPAAKSKYASDRVTHALGMPGRAICSAVRWLSSKNTMGGHGDVKIEETCAHKRNLNQAEANFYRKLNAFSKHLEEVKRAMSLSQANDVNCQQGIINGGKFISPLEGFALPLSEVTQVEGRQCVTMTNVNWDEANQQAVGNDVIDIKIGAKQADRAELIAHDKSSKQALKKEKRMELQADMRRTKARGYELCSGNGLERIKRAITTDQHLTTRISKLKPEQKESLLDQLKTIRKSHNNLANGEVPGMSATTLIGASVVIAFPDNEHKQPQAKLIDFGHAVTLEELIQKEQTEADFDRIRENFDTGITKLIEQIEQVKPIV